VLLASQLLRSNTSRAYINACTIVLLPASFGPNNSLRDRPDADLAALAHGAKIRTPEPTDENAAHAG